MPNYLITGARTGLGLANVRLLAQDSSSTIFACVRSLTTGDLSSLRSIQSASPAKINILECDTSSETSIAALPSRISAVDPSAKIDVLINMAAILQSNTQTSLSITAEALNDHMNVNVLGPARVTSALLPLLSAKAKIVNITSGLGSMELLSNGSIHPEAAPYAISKAALNMLTVFQAKQLPKEMVVVCVDPGHCKTEMGGPKAVVEPEESARGLQRIVQGLEAGSSGRFLLYDGRVLPW
jgi:NAD(P)-dependent dehydrogenase (short-subunit alcohol dehydrogenase family)